MTMRQGTSGYVDGCLEGSAGNEVRVVTCVKNGLPLIDGDNVAIEPVRRMKISLGQNNHERG